MFIYIDESGTFVPSPTPGSWSVVAALCVSEPARKVMSSALRQLKLACGARHNVEIKLGEVSERLYLSFLENLRNPGIFLNASAADGHSHPIEVIREHMQGQSGLLRENLDKDDPSRGARWL